MELSSRASGNVTILDLAGRLESGSAQSLTGWLAHSLAEASPQLLVTLDRVTFIDSTGLSALVQALKRCRERNGELRISGLQQPVRIIFELTRLDRAFDIHATEGEALAAFRGRQTSS
jgi:anti-sigma B factor antagonist